MKYKDLKKVWDHVKKHVKIFFLLKIFYIFILKNKEIFNIFIKQDF